MHERRGSDWTLHRICVDSNPTNKIFSAVKQKPEFPSAVWMAGRRKSLFNYHEIWFSIHSETDESFTHHKNPSLFHPPGVNMGYMENSYSNSNNGGSVNSQDSLYQMKMSAAGNPVISQHHQYVERQPSYGYDPLTHGGYGMVDDNYATYPHLATTPSQQMIADDYHNQMMMGQQQAPSRQDYCMQDYAAVQKPNKKRLDPHMGELAKLRLFAELLIENVSQQNHLIMTSVAYLIPTWSSRCRWARTKLTTPSLPSSSTCRSATMRPSRAAIRRPTRGIDESYAK